MKYEFSGSCDPAKYRNHSSMATFSVGCFPILMKASGKGTKRGKVEVRVTGFVSDPDGVYAAAREVCAKLEAGTYAGPKNVRVGTA